MSGAYRYMMGNGGGSSALADEILTHSPWVYWKRDETSGTTAVDSSGNGRDGTYNGATLGAVTGPDANYASGQARLSTTGAGIGTLGGAITIMAMLHRTASGPGNYATFSNLADSTTTREYQFGSTTASVDWLEALIINTGGGIYRRYVHNVDPSTPASDWAHVACVMRSDGSNPKVYVDGVLKTGGLTNGASGTRRSGTGTYLHSYYRTAHFAIVASELSAAQLLDITAAAATDGF